MYRVVIALVLLVIPASAETYKDYECQFIGKLFDNCAVKATDCDPLPHEQRGGGMSRAHAQLDDAHPGFYDARFDALCKQVCASKITPSVARGNYCPNYRPRT